MFAYTFEDIPKGFGSDGPQKFITLLKTKWDEIYELPDVFRYKLNNLQEKTLCGRHGNYVLQLNPDRATKRRAPEQISNICQPFDADKFNFTKASTSEIMFQLKREDDVLEHTIMVNVSPISRYHSLLCPSLEKCLPQVVTEDSIRVALDIMFLAQDRDIRIGFNSLCALASVNHLHYHIFLEKNELPVEKLECTKLKGPIHILANYPNPAFCFQLASKNDIEEITKDIFKLLQFFLEKNIAQNIFMTRGISFDGNKEVVRVLVWARKSSFGVKQYTGFNVALFEFAGYFPIYTVEDFKNLQASDIEEELAKWRLDSFDQLCEDIKHIY